MPINQTQAVTTGLRRKRPISEIQARLKQFPQQLFAERQNQQNQERLALARENFQRQQDAFEQTKQQQRIGTGINLAQLGLRSAEALGVFEQNSLTTGTSTAPSITGTENIATQSLLTESTTTGLGGFGGSSPIGGDLLTTTGFSPQGVSGVEGASKGGFLNQGGGFGGAIGGAASIAGGAFVGSEIGADVFPTLEEAIVKTLPGGHSVDFGSRGKGAQKHQRMAGGVIGGAIGGGVTGGPMGAVFGGIGGFLNQAFGDSEKSAMENIGLGCIIVTTCTDNNKKKIDIAREYRDKHLDINTLRGYYIIAEEIVPFLKKNKKIKRMVRKGLVEHLIAYGKFKLNKTKKRPSMVSIIVTKSFIFLCKITGMCKQTFVRYNQEAI